MAHLFDLSKIINQVNDGKAFLTSTDLTFVKKLFSTYLFELLGIKQEKQDSGEDVLADELIDTMLKIRQEAKLKKDFAMADYIREALNKLNIRIKDTHEGAKWEIKK